MGNATAAASDLRFDVDGADPSFTPTPSLATGANFTTTFFWNASSGNHTLRAWADAGDVVSESNESNNIATAHVHVAQQLPNFVAQFVGPSGTALEGQQMWIGGGFRNSGNATATARYEIRVDGGLVASGHVTLAPGQNATVGGQWHATAGNHSASLVVDPYNETQETHELDNARSTSFTVLGIRDLGVEILDVTHRPLRTDAGDVPNPAGARIVRILVTNHADKSATADVSLFASGTGATNTSVSVGSTVATLAPHSSRIVEIAWQPVAAGDVTLLAHVWPRGAYDPDLSDNTDTHEDFVVIGGIGGGAVVR